MSKHFYTHAQVRGKDAILRQQILVEADSVDEVKAILRHHPTYRYCIINQPSIYEVDPDQPDVRRFPVIAKAGGG